ncbi:MAG: alpha/beta fold hydrolase [Pyrinomonadaceae bacterium]
MKKFLKPKASLLFISLVFVFASLLTAQPLTVREIMAEPSMAGMRVENEKLSPDGSKVVYVWNPENKYPKSLYLQSTSGGAATKLLSPSELPPPSRSPERENKLNYGVDFRDQFVRERENALGNFEWSPDSKKLLFTHGGDLYLLTIGEAKPKRFTRTQSPEFGGRFLDNDRILFSQNGNVFVLNIADSTLTQLTREANQQNFISVGNITPNKAGTMLAYVVTDASKQRQFVVPNFLPEYVAGGGPRRGWTEQKLFVTPADGSREMPFEIKLPKSEGVSGFRRMVWTSDGQNLIVDRVDKDTKQRQLFFVHSPGGKAEQVIAVADETDDKWQASLSAIFEPNPKDPSQLFYGSEKDGYNHLYLAKLTPNKVELGGGETSAKGDPGYLPDVTTTQLTKGSWQVEWAKWNAEGDQIIYNSTEENSAERQFYAFFPARSEKVLIHSAEKGMRSSPQMDEMNAQPTLLFSFSRWNQPDDLYAQKICVKCTVPNVAVRLTTSVPDSFMQRSWSEAKFIDIPSRDNKVIKSKIYLPAGHNAKQKYPMVVFVHGAGYLQNTINGWNNYYREFMFNELLTQKGYVVLDIDYRGSAGYGRDWRTDVYDFLGGKDFDDHIDAIDYMVKNYSVDQKRIGAYGGSYGGFMAAMLATRAPERIAAVAALRPVMDWKNYYATNPQYTAQRLGFPDKNPEAYKRSSPITYADKLERPMLILHGMSDDNVHVQDSMQMIEKLVRLGKTQFFESMLYPSENHGFVRPESWTDEYERILALFEKHLKN